MAPLFYKKIAFYPMKRLLFRCIMATMVVLFTYSCAEEQDFNQADDLNVTPTVASSLFYLESTEEFINLATVSPTFYSHTFNFDPFNEQFVADNLLDGALLYEIENTTSKPLTFSIEYLDEGGNVLDVEVFDVEPEPAPLLTLRVAYGPGGKNLDILRNTSSLRVTAQNLGDNSSTSAASEPKVVLRSAAEFRFELL